MSSYTAPTVPTQFVEANGIRFAYRRWGKRSGLPLVFNQHFTGKRPSSSQPDGKPVGGRACFHFTFYHLRRTTVAAEGDHLDNNY
jgi:hypothetical protein